MRIHKRTRNVSWLLVCLLALSSCGRTVGLQPHDLDGLASVRVPDVFERVSGVADNHAGEVHPFLPPLVPLDQHTDREKITFYFTASTYHDAGGNKHVGELLAITLYREPGLLEEQVQDHLAYALDHAMTLDVHWPRVATLDTPQPNAQGGTSPSFSPAEIRWQEPLEEAGQRIDSGNGWYPYVGFFTAGAQREARVYVLTEGTAPFRLVYTSQKTHRRRDLALGWLREIAASLEITPRLQEHFGS